VDDPRVIFSSYS